MNLSEEELFWGNSSPSLGSDLSPVNSPSEGLIPFDENLFCESLDFIEYGSICDPEITPDVQPQVQPEQPKKKRGRKRQRSDPNESTDTSAVFLTPEQLRDFTFEDLEEFGRNIELERGKSLTTAEKKTLKQYRRRISNRLSAQQSRDKKKYFVSNMEHEIKRLRTQNSVLEQQLNFLNQENSSLKTEVQNLHSEIQRLTSRMFDSNRNDFDEESQEKIKIPSSFPKVKSETVQRTKTAGVCLLIVMFSCALFFNTKFDQPNKVRFSRPSIPQVIPTNTFSSFSTQSKNRHLLELDPKTHNPNPVVSVIQDPRPVSEESETHSPEADVNYQSNPLTKWDENEKGTKSSLVSTEPIEESETPLNFAEFMNESNTLSQLTIDDDETLSIFQRRLKERPNTAFFAVSDFHQISVPESGPYDPQSNFYISILVPSDEISKGLPSSTNESHNNSVIEITCQVLEVNQTPFLMNSLHHHPSSVTV